MGDLSSVVDEAVVERMEAFDSSILLVIRWDQTKYQRFICAMILVLVLFLVLKFFGAFYHRMCVVENFGNKDNRQGCILLCLHLLITVCSIKHLQ